MRRVLRNGQVREGPRGRYLTSVGLLGDVARAFLKDIRLLRIVMGYAGQADPRTCSLREVSAVLTTLGGDYKLMRSSGKTHRGGCYVPGFPLGH